ncbi:MAG: hypothetical protein E7583_02525 [Ruminococcaceae bacterium]|nr:hypothetical protein [Oscillospiraceae bacterium]
MSCDHIAHSATRIQGVCILTGQTEYTAFPVKEVFCSQFFCP